METPAAAGPGRVHGCRTVESDAEARGLPYREGRGDRAVTTRVEAKT